eukprot:gene1039-4275_t
MPLSFIPQQMCFGTRRLLPILCRQTLHRRPYSTFSQTRPELTSVGFLRSLRIKWQLHNLKKPWNFDPDEFVGGARFVWQQLHEIVLENDDDALRSIKHSMAPNVYRQFEERINENESTSNYKHPATLEDAHIINVFGRITNRDVSLSILVEYLVHYMPTHADLHDFWDKPIWAFETPLLTFREEGYMTDPVDDLSWKLTSLNHPYGQQAKTATHKLF